MDSTQPLYQQLSSRFILLVLNFLLLLFVGFSLYFQHQQELSKLKYQQLPAIENHRQQQSILMNNEQLINKVLASKHAGQLGNDYSAINDNLAAISSFSRNNRRLIEQLSQRWQGQEENVSRLTNNDRRSIQLKDSVVIQLTLVVDSFAQLIAEQSRQQAELYRQISQDKLSDKAVAIKAKALSNLVNALNIHRDLHQGLVDALVMFSQLDLQYDTVNFDHIQQKTQSAISQWLINAANIVDINSNENSLLEQTSVLNNLLFNEQNTFAKWRGQLVRINEFKTELLAQQDALMPLLSRAFKGQSTSAKPIEHQFIQWLEKANVGFQAKHVIWLIVLVFSFLLLTFLGLIFSVRHKVKHLSEQSTFVVSELITKGEAIAAIPTLETHKIIESINQLNRPEYNEAAFKQQQKQHQIYVDALSRHSEHYFWQLPALTPAHEKLFPLLGATHSNQHWRHCFSRSDVKAIIILARRAKKQKSIEKITVISHQQKAVCLTVEYFNGHWCGCVFNAEEYRTLNDKNSQLQQQLHQQNQADKLATIRDSEQISQLLNNAMVSQQQFALAPLDETLGKLQLQHLSDCSQQQKLSAQLRLDDYVLTLSKVNFTNELHTALINASFRQISQGNRIYLNSAENIATWVTLESELFQSLIVSISQILLASQSGAELDIKLKVVDVNSAQQIIRMSFEVHKPSQFKMLIQAMSVLALSEANEDTAISITQSYVRDLQLVFNTSNQTSQQLESGARYSFDLPLALADYKSNERAESIVKLDKCTLLVIATDKANRDRICHQFAQSQAVVETMQDLTLFSRQISVKHLTKNRLHAIVISPEVYASDLDLITQHLASLPSQLQPKVIVVQPFDCRSLQRAGLYSYSDLPWFANDLIAHTAAIIKGKNKTNVLVDAEIFTPYRFIAGPVEVLLGVTKTKQHHALMRLLHWFGFQVTVVSQQDSLQALWKTGRYLVVLSEFLACKLNIDEQLKVQRGVFALETKGEGSVDLLQKIVLPNHWCSDVLAPALDIQKLTQQLSPWLRGSAENSQNNQSLAVQESNGKHQRKALKPLRVLKDSEPAQTVASTGQALDFQLDLSPNLNDTATLNSKPEEAIADSEQAFNLALFAQHQGSAELAALMLDDYLFDINASMQLLEQAIKKQTFSKSLKHIQSMMVLAKVIAAAPLMVQLKSLKVMLVKKADNQGVDAITKEQLQQQLNQLKLALVQLTKFAELI